MVRSLARTALCLGRALSLAPAFVGGALSGCGPRAESYPFVRGEGCETTCEPDAGDDAGPGDAGPPVIPDEPLEA